MMRQLRRDAKIMNALGLHLRAAAQFAAIAQQYRAEIRVCRGELRVDGKSVLDLIMLAAECGTALVLEATGDDAEAAVAALIELLAHGFPEPAAASA